MAEKRHYIPRNSRTFNRLLKLSYGTWLRLVYRVENRGLELFEGLKPPYVIVSNHVTTRDPFFIGSICPEPIYWVTSDGNMRTNFMRFFLGLVGSIPKSKAIPDLQTINWIVEVIRKRRGVVGLFPEGQASWDGRTLPLFPSTARLIKLLKVPVVAVRLEGAYLALPRWTWGRRRGRVLAHWSLMLDAEEAKRLSAEETYERLKTALAHDEYAVQKRERVAFVGRGRAEHVELALFACPECETMGRLKSRGNKLSCGTCGASFSLDRFGNFHMSDGKKARFTTIPEWDDWQRKFLVEAVETAMSHPRRPFLSDGGAVLYRGHKMNPLRRIRTGTLLLYPDRLELATLSGERLRFPVASLDGIGVLKRNLLEFYDGKNLFQVRFALRSISARKWADALLLCKEPGSA
jgi:1-acyl-sn-glycerol-3-phosphate acyltransferase